MSKGSDVDHTKVGMGKMRSGPLAGIKILDLTSVVMGPFATQILAQLGAEVTKIESENGDDMRHAGSMRHPGMGHIFLQANQGKRSVVLDLKTSEGHQALLRLVKRSDVFISNMRPQILSRLRLDYEVIRRANKRIIHATCVGFDQNGPYSGRPAYDDLIQGATCVPWLMQQYGTDQPCYAPVTLADRVAGLHVVYSVIAALFARNSTARGQRISISMFEAMTQFILGDHFGGLMFEPAIGDAGYARLLSPHRRPYRTKDGYLCVLVYNDKHWKNFFDAVDTLGTLRRDSRFATHAARVANIDAIYEEIARLMLTRSSGEWKQLLDDADIPNSPMNTPQDLLNDPHLKATGYIRVVDHPSEGRLRIPRNPTSWSDTALNETLSPAPTLGEHTVEVLKEIGYTDEQVLAITSRPPDKNEC